MRKWFVSSFIGLVSAVSMTAPLALAASTPTPVPVSGEGIEISPPVVELQANPGETLTTTIRIRNVAAGVLVAKGHADDFGASGEDGKPKILLDEAGETRYSLKQWIQNVPDLTLAPRELKITTVTIHVPANAEPGGHFGVIRFTAVPPDLSDTGVGLSASIGTLILLRVNGAITDKLDVAEFSANYKGKKGSFFEYGPISFVARIKNNGTVHEQPKGTIVVKDTFGKSVGTIQVNGAGGNVLPDSIRRFDQQLAKKGLFGHYTATLSLNYLANTKTLNATTSFWVIPYKLVLIAIIAIIAVFFLLRFGIRRYNKHILAQARRG